MSEQKKEKFTSPSPQAAGQRSDKNLPPWSNGKKFEESIVSPITQPLINPSDETLSTAKELQNNSLTSALRLDEVTQSNELPPSSSQQLKEPTRITPPSEKTRPWLIPWIDKAARKFSVKVEPALRQSAPPPLGGGQQQNFTSNLSSSAQKKPRISSQKMLDLEQNSFEVNSLGTNPPQEVVSITYEEIGLFPRSFSRVLDRFLKQIFSDVENLVVQEYRFYRYLFLTTLKCLLIFILVPFFINFLAKTYVVRPLIEYFWNKQSEIFLNYYQQKRAFAELKDFEEKIYFESLIYPKSVFFENSESKEETKSTVLSWPVAKPRSWRSQPLWLPPLRGGPAERHVSLTEGLKIYPLKKIPNLVWAGDKELFNHSSGPLGNSQNQIRPLDEVRSPFFLDKNFFYFSPKMTKKYHVKNFTKNNVSNSKVISLLAAGGRPFGHSERSAPPSGGEAKPSASRAVSPLPKGEGATGHAAMSSQDASLRLIRTDHPDSKKEALSVNHQPFFTNSSANLVEFNKKTLNNNVKNTNVEQKSAAFVSPLGSPEGLLRWRSPERKPVSYVKNEAVAVQGLPPEGGPGELQTESLIKSRTLKSSLFVYQTKEADKNIQQRYQEKTIELAQRYNDQSIEAITNFLADFISFSVLLYLFYALEIQINITKSFLLEVFFGLDDSKKSLLILLVTDLLVGYHSSNLWELFFESFFHHYGLPESQTGIFLLVATLPVLLDVLFKYLIFRHLNRSSPATVATYHAMIE